MQAAGVEMQTMIELGTMMEMESEVVVEMKTAVETETWRQASRVEMQAGVQSV